MKKLLTLMLGLALMAGTVTVTFARDAKSNQQTGKKKGGKKSGKKGSRTKTKGGSSK